jgi:hypothetical protein
MTYGTIFGVYLSDTCMCKPKKSKSNVLTFNKFLSIINALKSGAKMKNATNQKRTKTITVMNQNNALYDIKRLGS